MKPLYLRAIGLAAPGLAGWSEGRAVLAGDRPWQALTPEPFALQLLPPNERRRAPAGVRQAFRAAEDAKSQTDLDFSTLATVFATSDSDLAVIDRINRALAEPARAVSPTDFHNSVHNAASGYWSMALQCRRVSTAVGGFDGSFATGMLEAAALVHGDGCRVLLVAFDVPPPPLLQAARLTRCEGSIALVLDREISTGTLARLELDLTEESETRLDIPPLEALRLGNPALRGLPLLRAVALRTKARLVLPHIEGCSIALRVEPA
jgi:hypothetical protein